MTESERIVYELSKRSFLSIWSFANPLNEREKELCDVLVVCDPDVIIFSVKDIEYKDTGRPDIDLERWKRAAIEESTKQIYGAERALLKQADVIRSDRTRPLRLPAKELRRTHRVAVALGSDNRLPLTFADFGKGYVHVLDETSLNVVMSSLDTVSDFVKYLDDKEGLLAGQALTIFSKEDDLASFYLANGKSFPSVPDMIILDEHLWEGLQDVAEYREHQQKARVSYVVDEILERFHENFVSDNYRTSWMQDEQEFSDLELASRAIARENRAMRVEMGGIVDLLDRTPRTRTAARIFSERSSPTSYVFMTAHYNGDRELNFKELQARTLVARGLDHSKSRVVGILIERVVDHDGDALSMVYIDVKEWTEEWQGRMDLYRNELGFFRNVSIRN